MDEGTLRLLEYHGTWTFTFESPDGSTFLTSLPISSPEYLRRFPTKARVVKHIWGYSNLTAYFEIMDDYGDVHSFYIGDTVVLSKFKNSLDFKNLEALSTKVPAPGPDNCKADGTDPGSPSKVLCTCKLDILMRSGCACGGR